jgi:hypothetical protein
MKQIKVKVPFFINERNMEYLLSGVKIVNLDEIQDMIFKSDTNIYMSRGNIITSPTPKSEYPNTSDIVVANAIRYIEGVENDYLEIELKDSLYFHKLKEPVIKVNGYCSIEEDGNITITKITRLTLADRISIREELF